MTGVCLSLRVVPLLLITLALAAQTAIAQQQQESSRPVVGVHGYIQLQAEIGEQGDTRFDENDRIFVRRARIDARGQVSPTWELRLMLDGAPGLGPRRDASSTLVDAFIRWTRYSRATIQAGQFKAPFAHEEMTAPTQLIAIERSLPVDRFKPSRQVGVQLSGAFQSNRLTYAAGAFNGTGINANQNDNDRFLYVARVAVIPIQRQLNGRTVQWGIAGGVYSSIDAAVRLSPDFGFDADRAVTGVDNVFKGTRLGLELDSQIQFGRFDFWSEYLRVRFDPDNDFPQSEVVSDGWYGQGSYYLQPKRVQLMLKYETFDPNRNTTGTARQTWLIGVNNYVSGTHNIKLQLNYMRSTGEASPTTENKLLARMQIMFSVL